MGYNHEPPLTTTYNRLVGKVIIVTGASSGIGAAAARLFSREGAAVTCLARRGELLSKLVKELKDAGLEATAMCVDITDEPSVAAAVSAVIGTYGRLDGAFNNAGHGAIVGGVHELDLSAVDRVLNTNFRGTFICMKHEIAAMLKLGIRGSIVNSASVTALVANTGNSAYASSKWALAGLTKCAALDYARAGIRVNAVAPGPTRTELFDGGVCTEEAREQVAATFPMNYIAVADDVARAALFLLSDDSRWTTGTILPCDGGMSAGSQSDMRVLLKGLQKR